MKRIMLTILGVIFTAVLFVTGCGSDTDDSEQTVVPEFTTIGVYKLTAGEETEGVLLSGDEFLALDKLLNQATYVPERRPEYTWLYRIAYPTYRTTSGISVTYEAVICKDRWSWKVYAGRKMYRSNKCYSHTWFRMKEEDAEQLHSWLEETLEMEP